MYSDGHTLLSKNNNYVYNYGRGDETSIESYFDVPEELKYLKEKTSTETWRLLPKNKAMEKLSYILGTRYDFLQSRIYSLDTYIIEMENKKEETLLHKKYYADLETWGDRIVELCNLSSNLHPMSGDFVPHKLYLTPQCGEYEQHQKILERFAEINKSYRR